MRKNKNAAGPQEILFTILDTEGICTPIFMQIYEEMYKLDVGVKEGDPESGL